MTAEFWGIEVGSWAEWVSGVATVATLLYAVRATIIERLARLREQAELVVPMVVAHIGEDLEGTVLLELRNNSSGTITNAFVYASMRQHWWSNKFEGRISSDGIGDNKDPYFPDALALLTDPDGDMLLRANTITECPLYIKGYLPRKLIISFADMRGRSWRATIRSSSGWERVYPQKVKWKPGAIVVWK